MSAGCPCHALYPLLQLREQQRVEVVNHLQLVEDPLDVLEGDIVHSFPPFGGAASPEGGRERGRGRRWRCSRWGRFEHRLERLLVIFNQYGKTVHVTPFGGQNLLDNTCSFIYFKREGEEEMNAFMVSCCYFLSTYPVLKPVGLRRLVASC